MAYNHNHSYSEDESHQQGHCQACGVAVNHHLRRCDKAIPFGIPKECSQLHGLGIGLNEMGV